MSDVEEELSDEVLKTSVLARLRSSGAFDKMRKQINVRLMQYRGVELQERGRQMQSTYLRRFRMATAAERRAMFKNLKQLTQSQLQTDIQRAVGALIHDVEMQRHIGEQIDQAVDAEKRIHQDKLATCEIDMIESP
jgi:Mn-dependent DtxR family transcriptional regulator